MGSTHSNGDACAHHAIGTQHPHFKISDVHGAPLAAIGAGCFAKQLAHHFCRVSTLGQGVSMATVCGRQQICLL